jgi:hypothetical protein
MIRSVVGAFGRRSMQRAATENIGYKLARVKKLAGVFSTGRDALRFAVTGRTIRGR